MWTVEMWSTLTNEPHYTGYYLDQEGAEEDFGFRISDMILRNRGAFSTYEMVLHTVGDPVVKRVWNWRPRVGRGTIVTIFMRKL